MAYVFLGLPLNRVRRTHRCTTAIALVVPLLFALGANAGPEPKPWILLPLNIHVVPPEHLADGGEIFDEILAAELTQRGIPFVQLSLVDGLRHWAKATDEIGGLKAGLWFFANKSVERAQRQLVSMLIEDFDAIGAIGAIWPHVSERKTKKRGDRLLWDGVARRIPGPSEVTYVGDSPNRGSSLHVKIYDESSTKAFDGARGLETIHHFRLLKTEPNGWTGRSIRYEFPVRTDLFSDRKLLVLAAEHLLTEVMP